MNDQIQYINPDGLMKSPAFSQAVMTSGKGKTLYIGGQNAVNADRELIGQGDLQEQTRQVMRNIQMILQACGAGFAQVVKMSVYIVQGQDALSGFQAAQPFLSDLKNPPAVTVVMVSSLGQPGYLVEIEATAFISE